MYSAPQAPQSIGGVIDNAIDLFKASLRSCWLAALVYSLLLMGITVWMQMQITPTLLSTTTTPNPAALLNIYKSPVFFSGYLLIVLVGMTFNLMMLVTIVDVARGREGGNALSRVGTVVPWLPGAVVVTLMVMIACGIGFVLLIIPGLYLLIRWILWGVALCDERRGAFAALGTSWRLVGGNWWRTMTILSVVGVVTAILAIVFGLIAGFLGAMLSVDIVTRLILTQVVQNLAQVLYLPAITATMVAIYMDLKLRKDGADLEARLGGLGATQA